MSIRLFLFAACLLCCSLGATAYDTSFATNFVRLSYGAYCAESDIMSWQCKWCTSTENFGDLQPQVYLNDDSSGTAGYVGFSPSNNAIVVVFRGTVPTDWNDIVTDLKASLAPAPWLGNSGSVHQGFAAAFEALSPAMVSAVGTLLSSTPNAQLYLSGHSLGGALATLAAAFLSVSEGFPNAITLFSFGSPRVGDPTFYSWFSGLPITHWRAVNDADVVPHLPIMLMGYHHTARETWASTADSTDYVDCDSSGEDPNCSDSVLLPISISDHLNYFGLAENCGQDDANLAASMPGTVVRDPAIAGLLRMDREMLARKIEARA